jgi:hypothetical protein
MGWRRHRALRAGKLALQQNAVRLAIVALPGWGFVCGGFGCGGRVAPEPEPESNSGSAQRTSATESSGDGTTGGQTGSNTGLDPGLELAECVDGWQPWQAECPWFASDDRCYATKAEACACICPRDTRSTCLSGLPGGDNDGVWVSCD